MNPLTRTLLWNQSSQTMHWIISSSPCWKRFSIRWWYELKTGNFIQICATLREYLLICVWVWTVTYAVAAAKVVVVTILNVLVFSLKKEKKKKNARLQGGVHTNGDHRCRSGKLTGMSWHWKPPNLAFPQSQRKFLQDENGKLANKQTQNRESF